MTPYLNKHNASTYPFALTQKLPFGDNLIEQLRLATDYTGQIKVLTIYVHDNVLDLTVGSDEQVIGRITNCAAASYDSFQETSSYSCSGFIKTGVIPQDTQLVYIGPFQLDPACSVNCTVAQGYKQICIDGRYTPVINNALTLTGDGLITVSCIYPDIYITRNVSPATSLCSQNLNQYSFVTSINGYPCKYLNIIVQSGAPITVQPDVLKPNMVIKLLNTASSFGGC